MNRRQFLATLGADRSRVELYDIPKDPTELDNVAEKHPDVVKKLSQQLLKWQATLPPAQQRWVLIKTRRGRAVDEVAGSNAYPWPKNK